MNSADRSAAIASFHSGRLQETEQYCRQALLANANDAQARHILGLVFYKSGNLEAAEAELNLAIELDSGNAMYHNHVGSVLCALGKSDEGIKRYQFAIRKNPGMADAHYNLGNALQNRFQLADAMKAYQKAARINPDFAEVLVNLCSVYRNQGQVEMSLDLLLKAIEKFPDNIALRSNYLLTYNYVCESAEDSYAVHARMAQAFDQPHQVCDNRVSVGGRRVRVGYLSPDFRCHSVAWFAEPILKHHNRKEFEIFCYSNLLREDGVTQRLKAHVDHWRPVLAMPDHAVVEMIRQDGIDILVDLAGHTSNHRLSLFGYHPAPIQISYLGYPNTTGMRSMNYRLTDVWADPEGAEAACSETLLRLPEGFLCYSPQQDAPDVSSLPALDTGFVTFGCFNAMAKIRPELIRLWSRILKELPDSRLIIKNTSLGDKGVRKDLLAQFRKHGVQTKRIQLYAKCELFEEHMALYRQIDIGLDTYPYNGTTTTYEALWMGVPVVSQSGPVHASRVGNSILKRLGMPELVGESEDHYVRQCVTLAESHEQLAKIRAGLRSQVLERLCNGRKFTATLESVYHQLLVTHADQEA